MMASPVILGAVLAGGASSRFGTDKALHLWQGRPLLEHALAALAPHCDALLVAGRASLPGRADVAFAPDRPAPGLGPLGGLSAALHHAFAKGHDRVLTAGCDTPVIPPALLQALLARPGTALLVNLPVIGVWSASLSATLDDFLARTTDARARSLRAFADHVGAERLDLPAPPNINRPEDITSLAARS